MHFPRSVGIPVTWGRVRLERRVRLRWACHRPFLNGFRAQAVEEENFEAAEKLDTTLQMVNASIASLSLKHPGVFGQIREQLSGETGPQGKVESGSCSCLASCIIVVDPCASHHFRSVAAVAPHAGVTDPSEWPSEGEGNQADLA